MHAERAKEREHFYLLILMACVFVSLLALMGIGSHVYRSLVENQNISENRRATLTYLQQKVRAADRSDAVLLRDGPEGTMLVLQEQVDGSSYETRIYLYQGNLVEEYRRADESCQEDEAAVIAQTDTFEVSFVQPGLLAFETQYGKGYVAVRSLMEDLAHE